MFADKKFNIHLIQNTYLFLNTAAWYIGAREMSGSNLCRGTCYSHIDLLQFSSILPGKYLDSTSKKATTASL
jgi:hypothetical protein